jgi:hypothetical protein
MRSMAADRVHFPAEPAPRAAARPRHLLALAIAAIAILSAVVAAPAATGAASVDPYGDELMRLTNLDRGALGKPSLAIDPTLASFARDLAWTCPTNGSLVLRGRAADMAGRSYFSHYVKGCLASDGSDMSVLDVMSQALGYRWMRGENIAWNSYGTAAATYSYGCAIDGTGCAGTTSTSKTVEVAERGFMQSAGHRSNILNSYDRFGCGSSLASDGSRYYACVFSLGAPPAAPTPTPTPTLPPGVVADTIPPAFVGFTGTSTVHLGYRRTIGTTVADDRGLLWLEVRVDGRLARTWSLSGTRAARSVVISATWLKAGRHQIRWNVRDAAGNLRTRAYWLYVR